MKKYALVIDHKACWGCKACEVACKQENNAAEGIQLISVFEDGPTIINGKLDFLFQINVCRHCDDPPCAKACSEKAINKREDGIVIIDYEKCTGCQACMEACPYDAIVFDMNQCIVQKCNLCYHRVDKGLIPACADNVCLAHCIYFGDPNEIQKMITKRGT